ncbi:MAG: ABC transporter ATP-binding protein [Candidatus Omnitrophota bacterium]|jgi:ABC-2 type transport system ATP-binding protein
MSLSVLFEAKNISKYFGKSCVVNDVSLKVNEQEVFGLLGPNGAGKTTLIKSILQLLKITHGEYLYKAKRLAPEDIYRDFGYLPENFTPPRELTGKEFLENLGLSLRVASQTISALLEMVQLDGKKKVKQYSRGMIQRLGLATALLKDPAFIILDEPMLGLDPVGQHQIMSLIHNLRKQGKTIFFSSHNLSQIEKLCDRIGVMSLGKIKYTGGIRDFLVQQSSASLEDAFIKAIHGDA